MPGLQYKQVVVPVDFSPQSLQAVETALEITGGGNGLRVLHVIEDLTPAHPGELYGTIDNDTRAKHATEALEKELSGEKYAGIQIEIACGAPGMEIPEHAKKVKAELIVMPSSGRTGISRLLIGSVAERVIRHAHCPVLVLRD